MSGVFESDTVEQLAHFQVLLRRAADALSDWHERWASILDREGTTAVTHPTHADLVTDYVRNRAAWAQHRIAPLAKALKPAGGDLPASLNVPVESAGALVPTLPPTFRSHVRGENQDD